MPVLVAIVIGYLLLSVLIIPTFCRFLFCTEQKARRELSSLAVRPGVPAPVTIVSRIDGGSLSRTTA